MVCAGLIIAVAVAAPPPAAVPLVIVVCVICPMVAAVELPRALAALRRLDRRALAELRRALQALPETSHPLDR
jgi:hypothetical protein